MVERNKMNREKILMDQVKHLKEQNNKLLTMVNQYRIFQEGLVEHYQYLYEERKKEIDQEKSKGLDDNHYIHNKNLVNMDWGARPMH